MNFTENKEINSSCPVTTPLLGGFMLFAPFTIYSLAPCSFQFSTPCSFLAIFPVLFSFFCALCSFQIFILFLIFSFCSMLLFTCNFPLFHAPFLVFLYSCSGIIICLLPLPILWLALCSFVSNRSFSLLQDYP